MGVFDQAAHYAAEADPAFVLARLEPLLGFRFTFRDWFNTRTLPIARRPGS